MLARILKIVSGIAAIAAFGFAVWHFRLWERDWSTIDDGWASLIGSAMGSFLAVVGALYVSKAEERRKKKEFEEFVKVAVQNLVVQASYLEAMAREPHRFGSTHDVQAGVISIQLRTLTDTLAVFDREISHSKDGAYKLRREVIALDAMLSESRHLLAADLEPTQALKNWHVAGYQIRYHTSLLLEALGWFVPKPSPALIAETAQQVINTWKSWNIPVASTTVSPTAVNHSYSQPVHHAHG